MTCSDNIIQRSDKSLQCITPSFPPKLITNHSPVHAILIILHLGQSYLVVIIVRIKLEYFFFKRYTSEEDIRNSRNGKDPPVNTKSSARINFKINNLNGKSVLMEANCTR